MSGTAAMIHLGYTDRHIFAIPVPEWSSEHEVVINPQSSWIKFPKPTGWYWLKLPLDENYSILGLNAPPDKNNDVHSTLIRSHIIANAKKYDVNHQDSSVYLIVEMFFKLI